MSYQEAAFGYHCPIGSWAWWHETLPKTTARQFPFLLQKSPPCARRRRGWTPRAWKLSASTMPVFQLHRLRLKAMVLCFAERPTVALALSALRIMRSFPRPGHKRPERTVQRNLRCRQEKRRRRQGSYRVDTLSAKVACLRSLRKSCQHT